MLSTLQRTTMRIALSLLAILTLYNVLTHPLYAETIEHVLWQRTPIVIALPIGKERQVHFPEPVEIINHQPELTHDKLTLTNNAGTVYFKATAPLTPARLTIHLLHSHTVVLLDISTTDAPTANVTPLAIVLPEAKHPESTSTNKSPLKTNNLSPHTNPIALVRFAIGEVYASSVSLSHRPADVHRVPLRSQRHIDLFYGGNTTAIPLASWRSHDWTITAVAVQNTLSTPTQIDPRNVHGNWVAMSIFPRNQLAPKGHPTAVTTVFLLSHRAFQDSLSAVPDFQHPPLHDAIVQTPMNTPLQPAVDFPANKKRGFRDGVSLSAK